MAVKTDERTSTQYKSKLPFFSSKKIITNKNEFANKTIRAEIISFFLFLIIA